MGLEYPLRFLDFRRSACLYEGLRWRMENGTVYTLPPGIQMLRESGFPIARFDYLIEAQRAELDDP